VSQIEQGLRRLVGCLRARRCSFALVGGLAVSVRGEPRFTRDADLCVTVQNDVEAESLVRDLRAEGYEVRALVEQHATRRLATARLVDLRLAATSPTLDLLFASSGIEREVVEGAQEVQVFEGLVVPVASRPALLALKVLSRDDRTRPQDRVDLVGLLAGATPAELEEARDLLRRVEERGYARGRDLLAAFRTLEAEAGAP
jgi:hypothetical protein